MQSIGRFAVGGEAQVWACNWVVLTTRGLRLAAAESESVVIRGGTGFAAHAPAGSRVRITDLEGQQVADLVLLSSSEPDDAFSQAVTRKLEGSIYVSGGSTLWSIKCHQLARIEEDTVGMHDILSSACSPYDYPIRFGVHDHRSCLANLTESLQPFGIGEAQVPDPFNVFMNQSLSPKGELEVVEPLSRAGDHLTLRILTDCVVAVSACPNDQNRCNAGVITDLSLELIPEETPSV
jgi:uncharacterized protein YcgI (DUF1989 family)